MQIIGMTQTNFNIFNDTHQKLTVNTAQRAQPTLQGQPQSTNMSENISQMNLAGRENTLRSLNAQREAFYSTDETLNYTPGNLSVEDEIRLATQSGFAGIIDGKLTPSISQVILKTDGSAESKQANALALVKMNSPSPFDFEQKVNNLKSLYEHLGDTAINYSSDFENALNGLIDDFVSKGGFYVNADKEGVADSIRSMFNGTEGKYTVDDLKTMAVLSFERIGAPESDNELQVGMKLGLDALSIEMARNAGKLSDAAYATVKDAFNTYVDDVIKQMNSYIEQAKNDPFMSKEVAYSPVRPELVYKAIDVMLGALENADYNQGLREAIKTLESMHNSQRDSQQENGKVDHRFSGQFTNPMTRVSDGDYLQITSKSLTDYLNRPEWSVNGNPFPVSVTR